MSRATRVGGYGRKFGGRRSLNGTGDGSFEEALIEMYLTSVLVALTCEGYLISSFAAGRYSNTLPPNSNGGERGLGEPCRVHV